ncbi:MAG: hypothetical protein ACFFCQ_17570 [Promethearchaeota archaeon]
MDERLKLSRNNLPLALMTLSGGFDSAIAALVSIRAGFFPKFLFFDNNPFDRFQTKQKVIKIANKLIQLTNLKNIPNEQVLEFIFVPHGLDLREILQKTPRNLTCLLCRRQMFRAANQLAITEGIPLLVTGEILGEQASQTLKNLLVVEEPLTDVFLLRPLLGFNKEEIVTLSRQFSLYELCTEPGGCCSANPKRPRTNASFRELHEAERLFEFTTIVSQDIANVTRIKLPLSDFENENYVS